MMVRMSIEYKQEKTLMKVNILGLLYKESLIKYWYLDKIMSGYGWLNN